MLSSDRPQLAPGTEPADQHDGPAPLRLAAAGCGRVFERFHAPALRTGTGWTLVAACDPDHARRARIRELAPAARAFETLDALLETCEVDAVLITAPPALHTPLALSCLTRGKHVLVEKPLALSVADGERMVAAARDTGTLLWVGRPAPVRAVLRRRSPRGSSVGCPTTSSRSSSKPARALAVGGRIPVSSAITPRAAMRSSTSLRINWISWPGCIGGRPSETRAQRCEGGVRYELRWPNGVVAACLVGHGAVNRDRLTIRLTDCTLVRSGPSAERFRHPPAPLADRLSCGCGALRQPHSRS